MKLDNIVQGPHSESARSMVIRLLVGFDSIAAEVDKMMNEQDWGPGGHFALLELACLIEEGSEVIIKGE